MEVNAASISEYIRQRCINDDNVIAVITMGSCARNEETYFLNNYGNKEMLSDYEMLIIVKALNNTMILSSKLNELRNQLLLISNSTSFDLEWSFKTREELDRLDKRFIYFETRESGKVIYGDKNILNFFPIITISNLNYSELNTVIIHRLYHVVRDLKHPDEHYKKYLIARNSLDFATAILPLTGRLVATYEKRQKTLEELSEKYNISKNIIHRLRDYLNMKKDYDSILYKRYELEHMLSDFYSDFILLKEIQAELQNNTTFRINKRKVLSSIYRKDIKSLIICFTWKKRLNNLCRTLFKCLENRTISNCELQNLKNTMEEYFGYC